MLQGLVVCGRCGERMTVRYHQRGGRRIVPDYLCQRDGVAHGTAPCQRIPGRDLDAAVGTLLVAVMTPETIAVTLAIHDELRAQAAEAELAQRRYVHVDPENRLVADVLESEWNANLRALLASTVGAECARLRDDRRPMGVTSWPRPRDREPGRYARRSPTE